MSFGEAGDLGELGGDTVRTKGSDGKDLYTRGVLIFRGDTQSSTRGVTDRLFGCEVGIRCFSPSSLKKLSEAGS